MRSGLFSTEGIDKATPNGFDKIIEGTAAVLFPPANTKVATASHTQQQEKKENNNNNNDDDDGQAVFYNPAQVVNRDLSVCALACFARLRREEPRRRGGTLSGITILEALSATGLRAIRYYKEVAGIRYIIANDLDADAVACIRRNCEYNGVPCVRPTLTENFPSDCIHVDEATGRIETGGAVIPNLDDANDLMFRLSTNQAVYTGRRLCVVQQQNTASNTTTTTNNNNNNNNNNSNSGGGNCCNAVSEVQPLLQQELMDVVDLDPYGSASPFLDAAMRCIKEGGLLFVTSTDSAILCGNYPDTCHAKYNTVPSKNAACHEMAVRILLAAMERVANKHRKYIVPLLSLHIDFYVRCFVRVYTQPAEVKLSPCKLGYLLQCSHCPAYWVRPMAVARARSRKRGRRGEKKSNDNVVNNSADNMNNNTEDNHNNSNDNNENNNKTDNNNNNNNENMECNSNMFGRECFPASPLRQSNPNITSLSLRQLPSSDDARCCHVCGAFLTISGPLYSAPTQCALFLSQLLQEIETRGAAKQITSHARVAGLVRLAMEELTDTPLFYQLPDIASFVRVRCPPTPLFVGALGRMGYRCSQVHCAPSGIKTDCPPDVLVRVMLQWKQQQEEKEELHTCDSKLKREEEKVEQRQGNRGTLLTPLAEADFSYDRKFDFRGAATGVAKFIPNAPNWGPKRRHQGAMHENNGDDVVE